MEEGNEKLRVLAWDVGVRNLAGCQLVEDATSPEGWTVEWWDVYDLREPVVCAWPCCGRRRVQGQMVPCTEAPDWQLEAAGMAACGRHKKLLVDKEKALLAPLSAPTEADVSGACMVCQKRGRMQFQEQHYCVPHAKRAYKQERERRGVQRVTERVSTQGGYGNPDQWKERLWRRLDEETFWLRAQWVVVENQPALRNPTMKSIAETLHSFFLCRGVIDREITGAFLEKVRYVAPMATGYAAAAATGAGVEGEDEGGGDTKKRYRAAKRESVHRVRHLLPTSWSHFLERHAKKDDLCDALLLAQRELLRQMKCRTSA